MTNTKKCRTCGETKPLDAFGKRSNGQGRVYPRPDCRPCANADQKARNAARADTIIDHRDTVPDYKLREEWTFLRSIGVPNEQIALQLGYTQVDSMLQALHRAGIQHEEPPQPEPFTELLTLARQGLRDMGREAIA